MFYVNIYYTGHKHVVRRDFTKQKKSERTSASIVMTFFRLRQKIKIVTEFSGIIHLYKMNSIRLQITLIKKREISSILDIVYKYYSPTKTRRQLI